VKISRGVVCRVDVCGATSGVVYRLRGSVLGEGGRLALVNWLSPAVVSGVAGTWYVPLPLGELVSLCLEVTEVLQRLGDSEATLRLWFGTEGSGSEVVRLVTGWPGVPSACWWREGESSRMDPGLLSSSVITVSNPAAGAAWQLDFGLREVVELLGVGCSLTTSAAVANRYVGLGVAPESGSPWYWMCGTAQTLSLARNYVWSAHGAADYSDVSAYHMVLPRLSLRRGTLLLGYFPGLQGNDQVGDIKIWVRSRWTQALDWP
jgi:hypothetical protein